MGMESLSMGGGMCYSRFLFCIGRGGFRGIGGVSRRLLCSRIPGLRHM